MTDRILIKNGKFFNGCLNTKAKIKNVLIENGKIKTISETPIDTPDDTEVIDATNKWITPGFIDSHTHYDAELVASPGLKESARHGVTSIILGSCSVSAIFNDAEVTSDTFTRVEAIPREIMLPLLKKKKTWKTPKEWVAFIEDLPLGLNVASFLGHSDLRAKAMGIERSLKANESATSQEQKSMSQLLESALDEGFLGLSTMDSPWDKMDGDKYWSCKTPSFYSSWKERKPLIKILRKRGAILQGAPNLVTRINAVNYMAASTGIFRKPLKTTMIALMDLIADRYIMPLVATATFAFNRLLNANFRMQSPPCPFTVYYDGVDSVMFEEFPSGQALRHLAKDINARDELIKDDLFREQFKKEFRKKYAPKVWHRDLSIAIILECPEKEMVGKNFMQIAKELNIHPVDAFLDLVVKYDKQIRWTTTIANDRKNVLEKLYNSPNNLISFSDAGAHLRNMAFYDFPLKMIKNVQESIDDNKSFMSMEKCIWRLTKEQADWFNLDCGYLEEGKIADISIIDPSFFSNITEEVFEEAIEEFDNYPRLVNRCDNVISQVLVGGKIVFENQAFVTGYGKTQKYGRFLTATLN